MGIQARYSTQSPETLEREVKALLVFHRRYGLNDAIIVTYSEEKIIETPDIPIRVVPLSKWLLS